MSVGEERFQLSECCGHAMLFGLKLIGDGAIRGDEVAKILLKKNLDIDSEILTAIIITLIYMKNQEL